MKYFRIILLLTFLLPVFAQAQQAPPDAATLQRLLVAVENQRNQALTAQAIAEARANGLAEKIKELELRNPDDKKESDVKDKK